MNDRIAAVGEGFKIFVKILYRSCRGFRKLARFFVKLENLRRLYVDVVEILLLAEQYVKRKFSYFPCFE